MLEDGSTFRDIKEIWFIFKEEYYNVILLIEVHGVNPFA